MTRRAKGVVVSPQVRSSVAVAVGLADVVVVGVDL